MIQDFILELYMPTYECVKCLYSTSCRNKYLRHKQTNNHLLNLDKPVEVVAKVEEVVVEEGVAEDDWETKYNALLLEYNALFHNARLKYYRSKLPRLH